MQCLIRVEIQTGRRLEDNLREFWDNQGIVFGQAEQAVQAEPVEPVDCQSPPIKTHPVFQELAPQNDNVDHELMRRVRIFNARRRRRDDRQDWSDEHLYQLAVCMGLQNKKAQYAAARLARSPQSCRRMFAKLKNAGVV